MGQLLQIFYKKAYEVFVAVNMNNRNIYIIIIYEKVSQIISRKPSNGRSVLAAHKNSQS